MTKSRFGNAALSLTAGALALFGMASANAASTWTFGDFVNPITPITCAGASPAAGCTQGGNTIHTSAAKSGSLSGSSTFTSATVVVYDGGLAVNAENASAPHHAMDNQSTLELILLRFDQAVTLSSIKLGWADYDSDITLLAYTGTIGTNTDAAATSTIVGKSLSNLKSANGWNLVGNYADVGTQSPVTVNSGNVSSSWWLVSAYNSTIGGSVSSNGGSLTSGTGAPNTTTGYRNSGYDYVKLYSVAGTTTVNQTPEPGSLALTAMALFGVAAARRRAKKLNK